MKLIQTRLCTLRLDPHSGDLMGVSWKRPRLEIIHEARLGENFRLLIPIPGYEANYFYSRDQRVARIEPVEDGVICHYQKLRNERQTLDVAVRYEIRAVDKQIEFRIEVDNRTNLPLAEVIFGIIGGQTGIGRRADTGSWAPTGYTNAAEGLFHTFTGGPYGGGNLGIRHSSAAFGYPGHLAMPWLDVYNRKANVAYYHANHDVETRLSALLCEVRPFSNTAVVGDTWPKPADVPRHEPIGLTTAWMNMPYARRGTHRFGPVVLRVHRGAWREACHLYREFFDEHFTVKRKPTTWLRKEMAWQSVIMANPEDVVIHRFKDLPRLAADAKKYGVTMFEILGWDVGGIDRGYPQYTPDPRLGSKKEFVAALRKIRALGVRPVIFANIQFADTATKWFRDELHRYAVEGRWAPDWQRWGWGEGTISARAGWARPHMIPISPSHPRVRQLLIAQYRDLARAGAAGLQLDKAGDCGHLDFNPKVPNGPDRSIPVGLLETMRQTLDTCRPIDPGFAIASEIVWDRAFQYLDVTYMRLGTIDMADPSVRYTFPEWTATVFAENPGDYDQMNNGMRYGLVWALAPRHYNDSLDEPLTRALSRYVRELIRIRKRHARLLFHGRFLDTEGATVKCGKQMRYSVFEGLNGGGKACVVVNFAHAPATATVSWPGRKGARVELCQPFKTNRCVALPAKVTLPPRSCAVVVQTGQVPH